MNVSKGRWFTALALLSLALGFSPKAQAGTGTGEAYGVFAQVNGVTVVPKTPDVVLPPGGSKDAITRDLINLQEPGLVSSSTLHVSTQGVINGNNGTITSSAEVESLNGLNGVITADLVSADSSSGQHTDQGNQNSARISSGGSFFTGLSVAGVPIQESPPPNTTIAVAGVGIVILNEQIETGDNLTNSSLTVNAIHVILMDGLVPVGDIIISSASSGVDYRR
jgi:hypothetical protein